MSTKDRRIRADLDFNISIQVDALEIRALTENISLSGVLIQTTKTLPMNKECRVIIPLSTQPVTSITIIGNIVRKTDSGYAINFQKMDMESLEHLKKLVAYNAKDPLAVTDQNLKKPGFR